MRGRVRLVVVEGDQRIETVAHRHRQTLRHAIRQLVANFVSGNPHRAAQHGVSRRENVFVAKPSACTGQQRGGSVEPIRYVPPAELEARYYEQAAVA